MDNSTTFMRTELLYLHDTCCFAARATLLAVNSDERGRPYALLDQTIFYPQGGGQPSDHGQIAVGGQRCNVTDVRFADAQVRHYGEVQALRGCEGASVAIEIDRDRRLLHAAYHTAGHWLAAVVTESLGVPAKPLKGHHFPGEAYIGFEELNEIDWEAVLEEIPTALLIDRQARLGATAEIALPGSDPAQANAPAGRPLRFVTIESYQPVGCGGTHLADVSGVGVVQVDRVKRKNGLTRLYYTVH